jgi:Flp pilus assembly protein TadB
MKNITLINVLILFCLTIALTSCEAIGDIFKTGVGVGIFVVIFIIALIGGIILAISRKK